MFTKDRKEYFEARYTENGEARSRTLVGRDAVDAWKRKCAEEGRQIVSCKKMYPVCSWEKNQHKLYNAYDRVYVAVAEGTVDCEALDRCERAMGAFDSHVIDGIVYATWENRNIIVDYVAAYDARH